MVRTAGLEPARAQGSTDFHPSYNFRCRQRWRLWAGLSLHHSLRQAVGAARQVSTPSLIVAEGLARDCHVKGFPVFEQFYSQRFHCGTQMFIQVCCVYQFHHVRFSAYAIQFLHYGV